MFIGITSHNIDLFLFGSTEESFRKGVVSGSSYPGKAYIGPMREKNSFVTQDVLGDPRSTRNSGIMSLGDMPWLFSPMA